MTAQGSAGGATPRPPRTRASEPEETPSRASGWKELLPIARVFRESSGESRAALILVSTQLEKIFGLKLHDDLFPPLGELPGKTRGDPRTDARARNDSHGNVNPRAQSGDVLTVEHVFAAPMIDEPLTRPMCSPIGDSAAATVVMSERKARELGLAQGRPHGGERRVGPRARESGFGDALHARGVRGEREGRSS